ncbi:7TM diverse intracellular signaling domain-containing protein [Bernardetia sp.]|uniref:7TM diverse intracellular signaling domain-containing protein n=1 Tax=Bernardetia sp. TaxID=1937974 RepID=UPI0025C60231|nr:7TM diverse intracellular signaling domain-containing protein [Bernardetia sp.]
MKPKILLLATFVVLLFLCQSLEAQSEKNISCNTTEKIYSVADKMLYLEDTTSQFISNPKQVLDLQSNFVSNNGNVLNFANTQSAFWFRFEVERKIDEKIYLEINNPMLDSILLFEKIENELKLLGESGAAFDFQKREVQYTEPNFLLPLLENEKKTFYLYIKSNFPTQTTVTIGTAKKLFEEQHPFDVAIGIYIGIMLVMGFYNLFVLFSIRDRLYLYYVVYVFGICLVYTMFKGYSFEFLWANTANINYYVPPISSLVVFFMLLFARRFLELPKNAPRLDKIIFVLLFLNAVSIIIGVLGIYGLSAILGQLAVILMAVYLLATTIYLLVKGYKPARFFLIAWFAYLVGLIIFILQLNAAIPHNWFTNNAILAGSALEVMLLSLALADRINVYKKQKDKAQKEILKKTLENENLIKEQNKVLETKVQEATEDLKVTNEELLSTNEELNSINEELIATVETVKKQHKVIEDANRNITDSLRYAQTIQDAILPFEERMSLHLHEYFTFYRPKDIVSGDFYWLTDLKGKIFLAVADCTGHGVPGAFMSMIGSAALDALVDRNELEEPDKILEELHITIQKALKQQNTTNDDGMDIGLCIMEYLDDGKCKIRFSGAKRPLYYFQKSTQQIHEIRGTRQSIGGYSKKARIDFEVNELILEKGDSFYLCSDGYADQNDLTDRKFGSHYLKKMLQEIAILPMKEQGRIVKENFDEHKGNQPQRDDVAIIGVRIV